jgi:hypothetical protein
MPNGCVCAQAGGLLERLVAGAGDAASPSTRADALQGLRALAECGGPAAEPHLVRALPVLLERQGDKARAHPAVVPLTLPLLMSSWRAY